jgi:hypothetical protein
VRGRPRHGEVLYKSLIIKKVVHVDFAVDYAVMFAFADAESCNKCVYDSSVGLCA